MWCGSTRRRAASSSARARRCARSRMRLRDVNWLGDGTLDQALVRRLARGLRQGALDAAAAAGLAAPRRRRHRGRTGRRRGRRFARPGLRVLRCRRGPGARARRRLHPERGRGRGMAHAGADCARGRSRRASDSHGVGDGGRWRASSTRTRSPRPMRAGRRSTIFVFGAVFDARPQGLDRRGRADRRPHPRRRRRHRHFADRLFAPPTASSASTIPSRCCARRRSACVEHKLDHVEALAVMDAQHLGFPDALLRRRWSRNTSSPRCRIRRRRSTSSRASRGRAARSSWSIISAPRAGCGAPSSRASRRWRAGSAGGRNSAGRGWRNGPSAHGGVRVVERRPMPPLGHFSLIRFERVAAQAAQPAATAQSYA